MYDKEYYRRLVWRRMEEENIALFPRPVYGRIPNFIGSDKAARLAVKLNEYLNANVIKANPDSPQKPLRELILRDGKILIMATPRIKKGFIILDPRKIPSYKIPYASTIRGAFKYGRILNINEIPHIDLIVEGSVAVSIRGERIGKGEGYGELEYAILRELDLIDEDISIITTVHEIQIFDRLPQDIFDVSIDYIITPSKVIKCQGPRRRPKGIYWDMLPNKRIEEIPILKQLKLLKLR